MGITIKELSEISGYSTATISRVISNKGNVKPETRKEIEKLLIETNYRTNIMELRRSRINSDRIMIIIGDLDNWYYIELVRILNQLFDENVYSSVISYSGNQMEKEEEYLRRSIHENYAGVIFVNVVGDENLKEILTENQYPAVFLNRGIKLAYFNTVCNDNYHGAYQATNYLIGMGHRKIGHLMGPNFSPTATDRRRGFVEAMEDKKIPVTGNSIYQGNYSYESGYQYGEHIIKQGLDFTAVFVGGYQMTEGLLDCLRVYGVRVPDDLSIISFDETPSMRREGVTTVCASPDKMGKSAVELLLASIADGTAETRRIFHEPAMIKRNSVKRMK